VAPVEKNAITSDFLAKDYAMKVDYLTQHFSRMWTRFNFFIALETAISGAYFHLLEGKDQGNRELALVAGVGLISSLLWYICGAEDRYLVEVYRTQVKHAGDSAAKTLGLPNYVCVGETGLPLNQKWYAYFYQWRVKAITTTKLAAWFPLLVCLYWVFLFARAWERHL